MIRFFILLALQSCLATFLYFVGDNVNVILISVMCSALLTVVLWFVDDNFYSWFKPKNCQLCGDKPDTGYCAAFSGSYIRYGIELHGKYAIECHNCCYAVAYKHKWFSIIIWNRLRIAEIQFKRSTNQLQPWNSTVKDQNGIHIISWLHIG